jgi:hypothetical protein
MSSDQVLNVPIVEVGTQNPPKQFTFVIPNGTIETLDFSLNFLRILAISTTSGVQFRFGDKGTPTDVIGAGIGYELPQAVNRVDIINNSGGDLTITVIAAIGKVYDDRLNVSGDLTIATPTQIDTIDDVTLGAASATLIAAANTGRVELLITNMTGGVIRIGDSGVGAASGVRIADGASIILNTTAAVYGYSVAGGDVSVSVIED